MGNDEKLEFVVRERRTTAKAVLVREWSDDPMEEEGEEYWLPLSQIRIEDGSKPGQLIVWVPEWLALDKGMI